MNEITTDNKCPTRDEVERVIGELFKTIEEYKKQRSSELPKKSPNLKVVHINNSDSIE